MDNATKHVVDGMLHELYLFRKSSTGIGVATTEEFDSYVVESAREQQEEIDAMTPAELAADMITDMLMRATKGDE